MIHNSMRYNSTYTHNRNYQLDLNLLCSIFHFDFSRFIVSYVWNHFSFWLNPIKIHSKWLVFFSLLDGNKNWYIASAGELNKLLEIYLCHLGYDDKWNSTYGGYFTDCQLNWRWTMGVDKMEPIDLFW